MVFDRVRGMDRAFSPSGLRVFSGLFTNLSAGWFGALLIFPNALYTDWSANVFPLTINVLGGIVSLTLAIRLEKEAL